MNDHSTTLINDSTRLQQDNGLYSQASNFLSHVSTGVDSRTGQHTLAIDIPVGMANNLAGPKLSPMLTFSSMDSATDRGFGRGCSLTLSELDTSGRSLRLSSGERYSIDMDNSGFFDQGTVEFFDRKIKSFNVIAQGPSESLSFRLEMKSGEVEILRRQGTSAIYLPEELRSQEGRVIHLTWLRHGSGNSFYLSKVDDESRLLLEVTPRQGAVDISTLPGTKWASVITLLLSNDRLSTVILPDDAQSRWSFTYEEHNGLLFLKTVAGPLGSSDVVQYSTLANGHRLPPGAPVTSLPRVTSWIHRPGGSFTALSTQYRWIGEHNFFGYGAALPAGWVDGKDNLYQVIQPYTYSVVETLSDERGAVLHTVTRSWNRFHLQTDEITVRGDNTVHVRTQYAETPNQPWELQPPSCQLPHIVTTTYSSPAGSREEASETTYDDSGNVLMFRATNDVTEFRE
jgi:hypothetical protein